MTGGWRPIYGVTRFSRCRFGPEDDPRAAQVFPVVFRQSRFSFSVDLPNLLSPSPVM